MTASRILTIKAAIGLAAVFIFGLAHASDSRPGPRPIAQDIPAFQAPQEPPADAAPAEEPVVSELAAQLTLQDALALALMHNPELAEFSWEVRASEARALQAKKLPNPELDVRLYRLGIPRRFSQPDEERTRVVVRQEFELGGKRRKRTDLARTERDLAGWDYEVKRIEVATVVAAHFAAVLGAQRRVESHRRSVEFFEETHDRISARAETGDMRSIEKHQSRRQVALRRIDLQDAEAELAAARFRLAATWGSRSPIYTEAVGDLDDMMEISGLDVLLELAQKSPTIARWDTEVARSEAELALVKADSMPNLNAGAGVRWEDDKGGRDWLVDMEIALPIFDRKQGDIREGRYNMARARAARKAAESGSNELISELYYLSEACKAKALLLHDEVLPAARSALEGFRLGFEKNAATPADLFDARRDLTRAEIEYTDALVEYHQALANLEGIIGRPLAYAE